MSFHSFSVLDHNNFLDIFQSGFRIHYSTESALLRVTNDLLVPLDTGNHAILILLDLSAAFDTVNHSDGTYSWHSVSEVY